MSEVPASEECFGLSWPSGSTLCTTFPGQELEQKTRYKAFRPNDYTPPCLDTIPQSSHPPHLAQPQLLLSSHPSSSSTPKTTSLSISSAHLAFHQRSTPPNAPGLPRPARQPRRSPRRLRRRRPRVHRVKLASATAAAAPNEFHRLRTGGVLDGKNSRLQKPKGPKNQTKRRLLFVARSLPPPPYLIK